MMKHYVQHPTESVCIAWPLTPEAFGDIAGEAKGGETVRLGDFVTHTNKSMGIGLVVGVSTYSGEKAFRVVYGMDSAYTQRQSRTATVCTGKLVEMEKGEGGEKAEVEATPDLAALFDKKGKGEVKTIPSMKTPSAPSLVVTPPAIVHSTDGAGEAITTGDTLLWLEKIPVTFVGEGIQVEGEGNATRFLTICLPSGARIGVNANVLRKAKEMDHAK